MHLEEMFFLSIALAKLQNINTILFRDEGVQKLENLCQFSDYALEIIEMALICLRVQYIFEHALLKSLRDSNAYKTIDTNCI